MAGVLPQTRVVARRKSSIKVTIQKILKAVDSATVAEARLLTIEDIAELNEDDGKFLAELLYYSAQGVKKDKPKLRADLLSIFSKYPALRKLHMEKPFFLPMLVALFGYRMTSSFRREKKSKVGADIDSVDATAAEAAVAASGDGGLAEEEWEVASEKLGSALGGSFNTAIKSGFGYKAGVAKWVVQNSEVRELTASCPFFEPMMLTIAK